MGSFLSKPITEKNSFNGYGRSLLFSWSEMQGWRVKMEDAHIAQTFHMKDIVLSQSTLASISSPSAASALSTSSNALLTAATTSSQSKSTSAISTTNGNHAIENGIFAVFDGHGGSEIAKFCAAHFLDEFLKCEDYSHGRIDKALKETFHRMDELIVDDKYASEICKYMVESQAKKNGAESSDTANGSVSAATNGNSHASSTPSNANNNNNISSDQANQIQDMDSQSSSSSSATSIQSNGNADKAATSVFGSMELAKLSIQGEIEKRLGKAKEKGTLSPEEAKEVMQLMLELKRLSVDSKSDQSQAQLITTAGCTAIVAIVMEKERKLYVANAGDSRGVLSRGGKAIPLSVDHKVTLPSEIARIQAAGGSIENGRVNKSLNLTRSIGDLQHKQKNHLSREEQAITAEPDVLMFDLTPQDEFFVLACDGVWDVKTNEEVVDFIRDRLNDDVLISRIIEELLDECLSENPTLTKGKGTDNMTCIVVKLKKDFFS